VLTPRPASRSALARHRLAIVVCLALVSVGITVSSIAASGTFSASDPPARLHQTLPAQVVGQSNSSVTLQAAPASPQAAQYVLLAWNDLGMHCYNRDFTNLAVLPPYNTLWAQLVKVGNPPQLVTNTVTMQYSFPANTYSAGKSNFWDTIQGSNPPRQIAQALFGLAGPLPANTGLRGKQLSGVMDLSGDHFEAAGIPLTEYRDQDASNPNPALWSRYPYQLAQITAKVNGVVVAQQTVVAPVSTEMHCDNCHGLGMEEDMGTGKTETNILTLHDRNESSHYPAGHTTPLMQRQPVLCAECHSSNALGAPGTAGVPSLSNVMHAQHTVADLPPGIDGCYNCHPGPTTRCLRDAMSQRHGLTCTDCHGTLQRVSVNPNPWLQEPRCDNANCHGSDYAQDQPLYRFSTGHGGLRCEACHDSTHAIALSREPNDAMKFVDLQGFAGKLNQCSVCHTGATAGHIHPAAAFMPAVMYLPQVLR
jgi:hypothetical protein